MSAALDNNYQNDVATITRNVIERFVDPKPFPAITEASVEDVDRGARSVGYEGTDGR